MPQRSGPAGAGGALRSPLGLAWRLQRAALFGWAVGLLGFGLVMGGIVGQVRDSTGSAREWYTQMGGSDQIVDAYRSSVMQMAGMAVAIAVVQMLLRLRTEEADGPLEPVLATAVSRARWAASHAATALIGATALLVLFATGMGATAGGVLGDPAGEIRTLIGVGLVQLPGILVVGALVLAAVGLLPRLAGVLSWALLLAFIVVGPLFGPALNVPGWVQDLSPFTHIPKAPAVAVTADPVLALLAAALAVTATGLVSLRRRDLVLPT